MPSSRARQASARAQAALSVGSEAAFADLTAARSGPTGAWVRDVILYGLSWSWSLPTPSKALTPIEARFHEWRTPTWPVCWPRC